MRLVREGEPVRVRRYEVGAGGELTPSTDYADLAWVSTLCDGDGGVRRRDACAALAAQFPFDRAAVEVDLPWDAWGGDVLDAAKLCDVRTGLKAALLGPSSCASSGTRL